MTSSDTREQILVARLHGPRDLRLHHELLGDPLPGDVRLRLTAVGLCGSDLNWYQEGGIGDARLGRPLVLGHEFAGLIDDGERAGERVVADPADPCEHCELCLAGKRNLCVGTRFAGHGTTDGALRSAMWWPSRLLRPLPDVIPDDQAALLEPLGVAIHALDLGHVHPGGSAAVVGCGPIGLLLVQLLRAAGVSRIVATDRLQHRVAAATAMGAHEAYEAGTVEHGSLSDSRPVDVAFEATGDDDAVADAITWVQPGSHVVLVGIPASDRTSFEAGRARRKGLSLVLCRRMQPGDLQRAVRLTVAGAIDLASLITHRYPLSQAREALAMLARREGLKVVVRPASPAIGKER